MSDTFITPNGTVGGTMKPNAIFRWVMAQQVKGIRRGGAKARAKALAKAQAKGMGTLALVTIGRRSGRTFETPVAYWPQPDGTWLVCASAAGAAKHPAWYWNLAGDPDKVRIVVGGTEIPVSAVELHGTERETAWQHIVRTAPNFLGYTKKTDRELPVIRLARRASDTLS